MDSPLTANLNSSGMPMYDANSPPVVIDISNIGQDDDGYNRSPLLFNLETPPEPISVDAVNKGIIETEEGDEDDLSNTDESALSSTSEHYLKPSSILAFDQRETISLADAKLSQESGSDIFSSYFDVNGGEKEFPWMNIKIEDIPPIEDTKVLKDLDEEFTIPKLVEAIRAK
ncbi:hypothetical protein TVAG_324220 [Trichomonas vaginalis G3]|uniref:Uncharacterized protein n=1 Tax=Trichomonas vaginalis (strain ATCC PRA-98 / G3) TaxID=412133 RepID=A2FT90_TRIV3|nr:hypothetical protein TVAG_324220 [Trichomonas vaginalis G3]|eukprot:XP_001304804.1 hypothetical protein [Trichomonas vaginalis G3]